VDRIVPRKPRARRVWVEDPIETFPLDCNLITMNVLLFMIVPLLLLGAGGFYFGSPVIRSGGIALILLIWPAAYFLGGFRPRSYSRAWIGLSSALRKPRRTSDPGTSGPNHEDSGFDLITADYPKSFGENENLDYLTAD
jgi:hypothetical protein